MEPGRNKYTPASAAQDRMPILRHEVRNLPAGFRLTIEMAELLLSDSELNLVRINKMIIDMLHNTDMTQAVPGHLSAYQLLDQVMGLAKDHFYLKHIELVNGDEEECPVSRSHASMISTLSNIVIRACKSMCAGTSLLKLTAKFHDKRHMIKIEDEVCAKRALPLQRVYRAFFTSQDSNTGADLPVALNIFKTNSEKPDNVSGETGTCFILSF